MNESHILNRKLNRYKRLVRRCIDIPLDDKKQSRKRDLEVELLRLKMIDKATLNKNNGPNQ